MSVAEWQHDIQEANRAYFDAERISRDNYDNRVFFDLYMMYVEGDEDGARGIANAHGFDFDDILRTEGNRTIL